MDTTMKQYLPRTALAIALGLACVAAQGKTFKCLSNSRLDCPTTTDLGTSTLSGTSDVETTTFSGRGGGGGGNSSNAPPVNTGGGSVNAPPITSIATPVPEPEAYAMMALGMGVVAWSLRRRRRA